MLNIIALSDIESWIKAVSQFIKNEPLLSGAAALIIGGLRARMWLVKFDEYRKKQIEVQQGTFYTELDRFYFNILQIAIEKPYLRAPAQIGDDREVLLRDYDPFPDAASDTPAERAQKRLWRAEYEAYAFIVWNFLETIHDRCCEYPNLLDTWATIIAAENAIHRGWFLQQMRSEAYKECTQGKSYVESHKFCEPFRVFIVRKNFSRKDKPDPRLILDACWRPSHERTWWTYCTKSVWVREDDDPRPHYPRWPYKGQESFPKPLPFEFPGLSAPPAPQPAAQGWGNRRQAARS